MSLSTPELPLSVPAWYFPFTGMLWGSIGLVTCYGLFRRTGWALRLLTWGSVFFILWYWVDRVAFVRSEYGRSTWIAAAILSVGTFLLILFFRNRVDVKAYFQEKNT